MPTLTLPVEAQHAARSPERWSIPRAATFVAVASGGLWFAIIAVVRWLLA